MWEQSAASSDFSSLHTFMTPSRGNSRTFEGEEFFSNVGHLRGFIVNISRSHSRSSCWSHLVLKTRRSRGNLCSVHFLFRGRGQARLRFLVAKARSASPSMLEIHAASQKSGSPALQEARTLPGAGAGISRIRLLFQTSFRCPIKNRCAFLPSPRLLAKLASVLDSPN